MKHKKTVLIKNEKELQVMRENGKIHAEIFEQIKKMAKP
jgi:methionine aminopeptidase